MKPQRVMRALLAALLLVGMCVPAMTPLPADAQAQTGNAQVVGTVVDQANGLPVSNADVQLVNGNNVVATGKTDSNGQVVFKNVAAGVYHLTLNAPGYELGQTEDVVALNGQSTTVRTVMVRSNANTTAGLRQIASVTSRRGALQTSSIITQHISAQKIQQQAILRVGDALLTLPNFSAADLDSAPGDDLHINIRGLKGSETATLIDGHPIGPIGVTGSQRGGYNYQLSPAWGFGDIQVAYGTGGLSLYGTDTVAGAVDFQTLEPTRTPAYSFSQGIGTQGRQQSILTTTGSAGRFGWAFASGVQGTWGGFKPQTFTQTALLAGGGTASGTPDVSPGAVAANTWLVSGNYILRSAMGKLRYELSPASNLTLTAYTATSWDDKTGEGDNDFVTPENAGMAFNNSAGATPGCAGIVVIVDNSGNTQCYNKQQYVSAFSGPSGGTPVAFQTLANQDYSLRLSTHQGNSATNATIWFDTFNLVYDRNYGGFTDNYNSNGEEISHDFISEHNDLGLGIYGYGQTVNATQYGGGGVVPAAPINQSSMNYFLRDQYTPNSRLTFFGTAWLKNDSVTNQNYFNPRATLMFRPSSRDVIRLSAGRAEGTPAISLLRGQTVFNNTPANLQGNVNCSGPTSVATGVNPTLGAEKATDEEVSVGHDFGGDSNIQFIAYDMNETNVIFNSVLPLTSLGLTPPAQYAAGYYGIIHQACGFNPTIANLGATVPANAGAGRYRGFDLTGRIRATRQLYFDYSYDVLSARLFNIPILDLQNNPNLIEGGQIDKVPVHQGALGFDYANSGWEVRFDGYYVGLNNNLLRPAYTFANASISKRLRNVTFNLGIYNAFNSQYDQFGRIGYGTFQPENQFFHDANALQESFSGGDGEQFGMPQRSFLFTVTFHN